ncbi:MAG: DNA polymerase III subunit gamma/tau [Eubacterium sp.]
MAYLALYRKYRPRDFNHVVGQEYITRILKNQILSGRVGHAYLFSGIRGTGKTSVAKIFARAINCENNKDGNPCNACEICLNIERPGVMDIIEIDGASNRGVDEIREIREKVKYPPTMGKYKVYIIDEVHMLTKEAFNALLKTLEEPPEHVVFILATTEPNKLPMTILSRCQRFDIKPIPQELIVQQMEKILEDMGIKMDREALSFIAYRGDSSMRDALSLLDQVIDIKEGDKSIAYDDVLDFIGMVNEDQIREIVEGVLGDNKAAVLLKFKEMREAGKDSSLVFGQIIEFLRQVLIVKMTGETSKDILGITESLFNRYKALGELASDKRFYGMIDFLVEEKSKLRYSGLAPIIVEMSLLKLCNPESFEQKTMVQKPIIPQKKLQVVSETQKQVSSKPPLESFQAVDRPPASKTSEKTQTSVKSLNTDEIYRTLVQTCQREKKMLVRVLEQGKLGQKNNKKLVLRFNPDSEGQAAVGMLKIPGMMDYLQKTIQTFVKDSEYTLEVETVEKTYEEMTDFEKTKSIINDERVEVIEIM